MVTQMIPTVSIPSSQVAELAEFLSSSGGSAAPVLKASAAASASVAAGTAPCARHDTAQLGYDLVVAADVFVYIGDLAPVMSAAAKRSSPG